MEPEPEFADSLFVQKVLRARRMRPEEKYLAGPRLYEYARQIAVNAVRAEHPKASPQEIRQILRQRRQITRYLEEHPL
jgi:hypothetical protein